MRLKKSIFTLVLCGFLSILLLIGHANANYPGNKCLSFDGVDDYVSCGSSVYRAQELTIELWIQPKYVIENGSNSSYGHTYGAIMDYTETWVSLGGWALYFNFSDGRLYFTYRWSGPYQGINTKTVYTNRAFWDSGSWYHVAVTYSPTKFSLAFYVNESIDREYTWTNEQHLEYESASLKIGGDLSYGYMFQGLIDEVRLWNVSRTHNEISDSWDRMLNLTECTKPELIGYWRFDEGAGLDSEDFSLQRNNMILGVPPYNPAWADFGAPIVPELPSFLIISLFIMIVTLPVLLFYKKKHSE